MEFIFKNIDMAGFERIWDSDYEDAFEDSHKRPFKSTPKREWEPIFIKQSEVMREVFLDDLPVGYIFISTKNDETAHLGYGLFKKKRGKGLCVEMCKQYLAQALPLLDEKVRSILATTLEDNTSSQKVLLKLNFQFQKKIQVNGINYLRFKKEL